MPQPGNPSDPPPLLRPDVVWFGESLDSGVLLTAFGAARAVPALLVPLLEGGADPAGEGR